MNEDFFDLMNGTDQVRSVFVKLSQSSGPENVTRKAFSKFFKGMGSMFYLMDNNDVSYEKPDQVPDFIRDATPYFLIFMLIENIILWFEKKPLMRLNDGVTSASLGIIQRCGHMLFRGAESWAYIYIYEHFRLFELPWKSAFTWYAAAIAIDFCYYWVHRASHEVHILWAQHQVHHSSEDYNLGAALRQPIFQGWVAFMFYLPLAFFLPPSHFIAHQQFNTLFQFWIHTQAINHLGPLEFIFNTPRHHRVHHGSNLYCLDKNYGGVFIIWDRIFGTFAEERKDEEIIYGLVYNQPSFNPVHLQTFYTVYVFERFKEMKGFKNKLKAIFYGPSWQPGKPRLGLESEKPRVGPRKKYNVKLPTWCNIYLIIHFAIVIYGLHELGQRYMGMNPLVVFGLVSYIIASLTTIGMLFDNKPYGCVFELLRCVILVTAIQRLDFSGTVNPNVLTCLEIFYLLSGLFWLLQSTKILQVKEKEKIG